MSTEIVSATTTTDSSDVVLKALQTLKAISSKPSSPTSVSESWIVPLLIHYTWYSTIRDPVSIPVIPWLDNVFSRALICPVLESRLREVIFHQVRLISRNIYISQRPLSSVPVDWVECVFVIQCQHSSAPFGLFTTVLIASTAKCARQKRNWRSDKPFLFLTMSRSGDETEW